MTRRKPRRYDLSWESESSITASQLRRTNRETQKEVMSIWFNANYQNPGDCCPYESAEGGYQFIYGGPFDPKEELEGEFGGVVRDDVLEELADELWEQAAEWTGRDHNDDFDDYFYDSLARSKGHLAEFERSIKDVRTLAGTPVDGEPEQCLLRLLYVNVITALEAYLCDFFISAITKHPELRRKFVKTNPEFRAEKISVSDIFEAWEGIEKKVNQYLVDVVWHHLDRVKPMFSSALGVKFPKDMGDLFRAILVRHDLVHRNGRMKEGGEHVVKTENIEKVIALADSLVREIEAQWQKVKPADGPDAEEIKLHSPTGVTGRDVIEQIRKVTKERL